MSLENWMLKQYSDDIFICNECRCGLCRESCPVYIHVRIELASPRGRGAIAKALSEGSIQHSPAVAKRLSLCTTCGLCKVVCSANDLARVGIERRVNHSRLTEALRAESVKARTYFAQYQDILDSILKHNNPYWEPHEKRWEWLSPTGVKPIEKAETLYFAGCTSSYRTTDIAQSTVKIFTHAKVPFTMLQDEICCGSTLLRIGYPEEGKKLGEEIVNAVQNTGANRVVTSCAGCYRTFKVDYPEILGKLPFEVLHITEFLQELINEKKLETREFQKTVTWHDPCHLGRHTNVYDPPRNVLQSYAPKFVETEFNREESRCCGAGGGLRKAWRDVSLAIARERIRQAKEAGAETLVTSCPFCTYNFQDAGGIEEYDLPVFIARILHL